jgi:hypothetical protein
VRSFVAGINAQVIMGAGEALHRVTIMRSDHRLRCCCNRIVLSGGRMLGSGLEMGLRVRERRYKRSASSIESMNGLVK